MRKKLAQQNGETLVESLVSMLIAVLSVGMIATCVTVAAKINQKTRSADEQFQQELQNAECQRVEDTEEINPQITIIFHSDERVATMGGNRSVKQIEVILYGGNRFVTYEPKGE